mmetsp:Transcript_17496/g.31591  ORF Transcript_17496/g.31591 Transcript_17496/m.31591 type:complete len:178 (-) Transcript_17496:247-780(-)
MYDSLISWPDSVLVLFAALFTAVLSEFLSWVLIYRLDDYKGLKNKIEGLSKKLEREREQFTAASKQSAQERKISQLDAALKQANQDLSFSKMKSTFIIAFFMIAIVSTLSNVYHGQVVAKLPFVPLGFIQNLSHRGLPGNDMTDCSMIFLYVVSSYVFRANVQKLTNFAPKGAVSLT